MKKPREFLLEENQDSELAHRLRPRFRRLLGHDDLMLPKATVEKIAACYFDADPVAEAFVDEVYLQGPGAATGRRLLDQALEQGVEAVAEAPPTMQHLFAELEVAPPWLNRELVEKGARVFRRLAPENFIFMGAITLEGYGENSVAKPLALTGAYVASSARQRFLETAAFWRDVSAPGGLAPGGQGRKTAIRVRIMHVFVRRRLVQHPAWSTTDWGLPINQGDALITLMAGSFTPGVLLNILGFRTSKDEVLALLHFWRYVGHLMGVQPRWYPETMEDAIRLAWLILTKGAGRAGDDERALAQSFMRIFEAGAADREKGLRHRLALGLAQGRLRGHVGLFVSPQTRQRNDLPGGGLWSLLLLVEAGPRFLFHSLRRWLPGVEALSDRWARRRIDRWFTRLMPDRKAEYTAVSHFTR